MLQHQIKRFNELVKEEQNKPEEEKGLYFDPEYNARIKLMIENGSKDSNTIIYIPKLSN